VNTVVRRASKPRHHISTGGICQFPRDPSSEEIETHGGRVEKHRESGMPVQMSLPSQGAESSRVTAFETRLIGGVRFNPNEARTAVLGDGPRNWCH
jgi:hypothetical protein